MAVQRYEPGLVCSLVPKGDGRVVKWDDHAAEVARLEAKLQAFADAGLAGPDGGPRKVLGKLAVTLDGFIIGDGAVIYWEQTKPIRIQTYITGSFDKEHIEGKLHQKSWSSEEAAARAAKEEKHGE